MSQELDALNTRNDQREDGKRNVGKPVMRRGKPKEVVTYKTHLTSLAHVSVLVFVYFIYKLAFKGEFDFFTWHPLLMATGWALLMTEGFYAINKYNTYWRLKTKGELRVKVHVTTLAVGYALALGGFAIAYLNKENKGKGHFATWHGLFGLVSLVATVPPVLNGVVLWYRKELAERLPNPKLVKFVHVTTGTLAFAFGALALLLSIYSNWYAKRSGRSAYWFWFGLATLVYPLAWALFGPSVKLVRVVRDYFSDEKSE